MSQETVRENASSRALVESLVIVWVGLCRASHRELEHHLKQHQQLGLELDQQWEVAADIKQSIVQEIGANSGHVIASCSVRYCFGAGLLDVHEHVHCYLYVGGYRTNW